MAFVFKAEPSRFGSPLVNQSTLGPGQYKIRERAPPKQNRVPFLIKGERSLYDKVDSQLIPGPGTYTSCVSVQGFDSKTKTFYSRLNPKLEIRMEQSPNSTFKSKTKRIPDIKDVEGPGPGAYYKELKPVNRSACQSVTATPKNDVNEVRGSIPVPSIPTALHAYGYFVGPSKQL